MYQNIESSSLICATNFSNRPKEDITPDAMNSNLEAEILKKIAEYFSETYVKTTLLSS